MTTEVQVAAAARLAEAEQSCTPIDRLTEQFPGLTVSDAYEIQPGPTSTNWGPSVRCSSDSPTMLVDGMSRFGAGFFGVTDPADAAWVDRHLTDDSTLVLAQRLKVNLVTNAPRRPSSRSIRARYA